MQCFQLNPQHRCGIDTEITASSLPRTRTSGASLRPQHQLRRQKIRFIHILEDPVCRAFHRDDHQGSRLDSRSRRHSHEIVPIERFCAAQRPTLSGCAQTNDAWYGRTVTLHANDATSTTQPAQHRKRIASLLPSTTEIVAALGLLDDLVAVTFECDYPLGVRENRAIAVDTAMPQDLTPGEIDTFVRARMAAGLPMYELDSAVVNALQPNVVLTQDLCQVCALPAGEVNAAMQKLGCEAAVVTYDPHSVDEVLTGIELIADTLDASTAGRKLTDQLRSRRQQVIDRVASIIEATGNPRPRVLVLEWIDPPFIAGHWVPELVSTAGGEVLLGVPGARSTTVSWEEAQACNPDVVLVAPCGFDLDGAVAQAQSVAHRFPNAELWAIDGNAYVTRPGPRLIDAIEAIAHALHDHQPTLGITARA
jgi:iron complex transport system substrate-binding protein